MIDATIVTFSGASDDLVEVDGCKGADEFNCYQSGSGPIHWVGELRWGDDSLRVIALYDGMWSFAVARTPDGHDGDGLDLPEWSVSITNSSECAYSTRLAVEAPADVRLEQIYPDNGGRE